MKRCISILLLVFMIIGGTTAFADEYDPQLVIKPTKEEILAGEEKAADMSRLVELLGLNDFSLNSRSKGVVEKQYSVKEIAEIAAIAAKYDSETSSYSVMVGLENQAKSGAKAAASVPTTKNLNFTTVAQENGNYCGPASAYMVLKKEGHSYFMYQTQSTLAGSTTSPTRLQTNYYNQTPFGSNWSSTMSSYSNHSYSILWGDPYDSINRAMILVDSAIGTLALGRGVVYDTVQYSNSTSNRLVGYPASLPSNVYHYVAGEGYNASNPSARICLYVDPNSARPAAYGHRQITFRLMCTLIKDRGLVF